ncbi:MAG: transcriptional regulator [Candidatus Bathyarchaeia archaeon]
MVSKDQSIGGAIFIICLIIAIFYVITLFYPDWLVNLGWASDRSVVQFWLVAIPVFIAFVAIMGIGAWIGWTMATTPPPKPIEEITSEIEEEEKKEAETAQESKETAETEEKEKGKAKK